VEALLDTIPVLTLDAPADSEYANIRSTLDAAGQTIGLNDLLIGTHAHALGLTLLTDNKREFTRIRGVSVENWLET